MKSVIITTKIKRGQPDLQDTYAATDNNVDYYIDDKNNLYITESRREVACYPKGCWKRLYIKYEQ